jgi:uncharacterized membrane protein YgcG
MWIRRWSWALAALCMLTLVTACGGAPARNAAAYDKWVQIQRDEATQRAADLAAMFKACTDDRCREHLAALHFVAQAGQGNGPPPTLAVPPPQRERDMAEKFRDVASASGNVLGVIFNAGLAWHQSDNAVRTSRQQFDFYSHAFDSMAGVATAAQPDITVAGDYITGHQQIGDNITGDGNATGSARIGDNVGRDNTGGNHADGSINGDNNRVGSPGPYDNSGNCAAGAGGSGGSTGDPGGNGGTGSGGAGAAGGSCGKGG